MLGGSLHHNAMAANRDALFHYFRKHELEIAYCDATNGTAPFLGGGR
jgi:hypothetical protein